MNLMRADKARRILRWVAAGCILYVSLYMVLSRVTAVAWEAHADNLDREVIMFTFFGEEWRVEDVGHVWGVHQSRCESRLDGACYYLFLPLIEVDARCGMRYHGSRTFMTHNSLSVW